MWISDNWRDYELLDCGGGERLERWGKFTLVRPDPQAIWRPEGRHPGWNRYDARYQRSSTGGGRWVKKALPERWTLGYKELTFNIKPMNFKHTGLFPEQAANWDFAMERIRAALDREYGKGEKILFGEPWSAHSSPMHRGAKPAGKRALPTLDENIGAFCDATRDLVKGHILHAERPGFVNGGSARLSSLSMAVTGWAGAQGGRFAARSASQTINYLSSHDDWTLWDKLVITMDPARCFDQPTPAVLQANRLAVAFCFACQGHWFMLAGEEFGRTKQGLQNSFDAPAALNQLDWTRAWTAPWQALADYYRGLIALRGLLPALCDKGPGAPGRLLSSWRPGRLAAAFHLDNKGPSSRWDALTLFFSAAGQPRPAALPDGQWQVLVDPDSSFRWQDPSPALLSGQVMLPAGGALILGRARL